MMGLLSNTPNPAKKSATLHSQKNSYTGRRTSVAVTVRVSSRMIKYASDIPLIASPRPSMHSTSSAPLKCSMASCAATMITVITP